MTTLIIEDEILAAERLANLIHRYDSSIEIVGQLDSVRESIAFFDTEKTPDLAFLDIQLADGLSFDIFEKTKVNCPVIFTTAFDEYALRAFKVNSIDYLLKPIDYEELTAAFDKFFTLKKEEKAATAIPDLTIIQQAMQMMTKQYKNRFIIKAGAKISAVPVEDIFYFFSEHRTTYLRTKEGRKHAIDYTIEQVEGLINPQYFFRLNRKYITAFEGIKEVSREKVGEFKKWLDQ